MTGDGHRKIELEPALDAWVEKAIITDAQRRAILALQAAAEVAAPEPARVPTPTPTPAPADAAAGRTKSPGAVWLPRIMIVVAVVLLVAGIFLFYASNWRHMPPGAKLAQVFGLLVGFYALAFVLGLRDGPRRLLSRAFLILGMASFGACIALIAQVFHISAHPSNGVLTWAVMVALVALVCREKIGLFIALGLFCVWDLWEVAIYHGPNYLFGPVALAMGIVFLRYRSTTGTILALVQLLLYFYQTHVWLAVAWDKEWIFAGTVMLHLPYGVMLICLGRLGERVQGLRIVSLVAGSVGWFFVFVPLVGLSWPIDLPSDSPTLIAALAWPKAMYLPIECLAASAAAALALLRLRGKGLPTALWWGILAYGALQLALPVHHRTIWMVFTHLGIVAFAFASLYCTFAAQNARAFERVVAIVFVGLIVLAKGCGFVGLGIDSGKYFVAYGVGFVIFAVVCLLINQAVYDLLSRRGVAYPRAVLTLTGVAAIYFGVYALSFELDPQSSIFDASSLVRTMLVLFLAIALGLFAFAWRRTPEKILVGVTGGVFAAAVMAMFVAGPSVSWVFYSIVFNVLLFTMAGAVIYYGTKRSSKALVMTGISFLGIHVTTRYFDLLWDMFSGSLLLISTGVLVLGGGYLLERQRRRLFRMIDASRRLDTTPGKEAAP